MYVSKKWLIFVTLVVTALFAIWYWNGGIDEQGPTASNDIPIIIRTNGGLLEVATVKHRRSFDLTKPAKIIGMDVPFCKETAYYTVDASITYRVKLAKRWVGEYSAGKLYLTVPPPEPAIPVAFDTSRLRAKLDSCWLMPNLNAKDDLLRSISGDLENDAKGPRYMKLAHGEEARKTIAEFAKKWILSQKGYDLPDDTPIEVSFTDE